MSWWGKLLGGTFGFMLGGPLGALIGGALGHSFDRGLESTLHELPGPGGESSRRERAQAAFFTATFGVMGHIAKADGRVSPEELRLAGDVMRELGLHGEMKRVAQGLFDRGKRADFPLDEVLEQLRRECRNSRNLLRVFLEIQLHAAYADGRVDPAERRVLNRVATRLRWSHAELAHLEAIVAAQGSWHPGQDPERLSAEQAYAVLGVSPHEADADVKRAYRRLMNQHHPDKLVAKGLPEEMMRAATEKTQEIKAAYERVKEARG